MDELNYYKTGLAHNVAVSYCPPDDDPAFPYQVDGELLCVTHEAPEGRYLVLSEKEEDTQKVAVRAIPTDWIVNMTIHD